jgi:hypothetical protein
MFEFIVLHELFEYHCFVDHTLVAEVDLQFGATFGDGGRFSSGYGAHDDACLFEIAYDQSILYIEAFDLASGVIVNNPPVGHNTVYVEKNGFDLGSFLNLFFIVSAQSAGPA